MAEVATERRRRGRPRQDEPSAEYLARREEIIDAAVRAFGMQGYESATLDDIAAAVDFRRASLYHYVPSKAHLLYLIHDRATTAAIRQLEDSRGIDDPRERLVAFVRTQVMAVAQQPGLVKVLFDDRGALDERYEGEIVEKERHFFKEIVALVKEAVDAKVIPPVDPWYGAQVLLGATTWHYKWFDPDRHDPEAVAESCLALLAGTKSTPTRRRK
jgi:TetR/AcrR family transcriptional regulator, cholesterol catabolism regulator